MRKSFVLCLALALLAIPAAAEEMSVDDVIAKNIETRGGLDAWQKVDSAKISGKMSMPGGLEMPMTIFYLRPNSVRMEMEMQGQKIVQAYDGATGWQIMPLMGKTDAQKMNDAEVEMVKRQADFEGPLVDYQKKGHTIEMVGKEDVDGTEAYKLKVTLDSGHVAYTYLDTEYFLEFKQATTITNQAGQDMKTEVEVGDYKEVGDLMLAHSLTFKPEGMDQGMGVVFDSVELNPEGVDASLFAMPESAPAAPTE